jgi:hypothetical protein
VSSKGHRPRVPVDLSAASSRMREHASAGYPKRIGRPRTRELEPSLTGPSKTETTGPEMPKSGTVRAQTPKKPRVNTGDGARAQALQTPALSAARLLDLRAAATYLGLAPWTTRELEWWGVLRRVRVPLPKGGELRKLLFDRVDLDELISRWKDVPPVGAENAALSGAGASTVRP